MPLQSMKSIENIYLTAGLEDTGLATSVPGLRIGLVRIGLNPIKNLYTVPLKKDGLAKAVFQYQ